MDARNPRFLEGHIAPGTSRFEVLGGGVPSRAVCNGVLRGPAARCQYIASVACDDNLVIKARALYRLELDMYVAELAGLELRMGRKLDASALAVLWVDDAIEAALGALDIDDKLDLRDGNCTFTGEVMANDRERMQAIVHAMTAIAGVPERRAQAIVRALAGSELRSIPARLALDGDGVVVLARTSEIVIGVGQAPSFDGDGLRTRVHARRDGGSPLLVVDAGLPKKQRPRGQPTAEHDLPVAVRRALAAARPSALVATADAASIVFAGFVVDRARLRAAIDCVVELVERGTQAPYR